jgi:hypothetical protein
LLDTKLAKTRILPTRLFFCKSALDTACVLPYRIAMNTFEVLKAESKKHRAIADKIDELLAELQGDSTQSTAIPTITTPSLPGVGEYANMRQAEAIIHVLKKFGPQTTTDIFHRLNNGGMTFKKVAYVTAILARFKDKWERLPDNKISLKSGI